jgi:xylitol oxidase
MGEQNWAGSLTYGVDRVLRPRTVDEVRRYVAGHPVVKAIGTRHCFSDVADSTGAHIDLGGLDVPMEVDRAAATVTLCAAARYGDFAPALHEAGFALPNLASLPHCSVAGSIATATHGSGLRNQNLAAVASGVELVTADGEAHWYTREDHPDVFPGLAVNLGALGVLTKVRLDLVEQFDLRQDGYVDLTWDEVLADWPAIQDAGYSVSMFTRWTGDPAGMILVKTRLGPGAEFAVPAVFESANAVPEPPGPHFTEWGAPGPSHTRLAHFRLESTPSVGDELQSEYFVPHTEAVSALNALRDIGDQLADALYVSEVRTVAGDDLWLSPAYGGDRLCLAFTWQPKPAAVQAVLPLVEERLAPFGARAHWGKLSTPDLPLDELYPELPRFRELAARLDPDGKFRNAFLDRRIFGS